MPVLGAVLEIEYVTPDGEHHHRSITPDPLVWMKSCPVCEGGGGVVRNAHTHVDAEGRRWTYFASSDEEKAELQEVLEFLRSRPESVEDLVAELERRGALVASLGHWTKQQLQSLPRLVVEVALAVVVEQLLFGANVSQEDLERILRDQQEQYRHHQTQPDEQTPPETDGDGQRQDRETKRPGDRPLVREDEQQPRDGDEQGKGRGDHNSLRD